MKVQSLRFGQLEIPDNKVIFMKKPVLGFEGYRRYCLVEVEEINPFLWFQSIEDPAIAFLVVNPRMFVPEYKIEVVPNEIAELDITQVTSVETYVIVTIPSNPEKISINLQGPILINTENNRAKQLVLVNSNYKVRFHFLDTITAKDKKLPVREKEPVGV